MSDPAIYELLDSGVRRARHHVQAILDSMCLRDHISVAHDGERILIIGARCARPTAWERMDVVKLDPAIPALHSDRMVQGVIWDTLRILYKGTDRERYFYAHLD